MLGRFWGSHPGTQALRSKLVQSGWRDEIKSYVADLIEARGVDNVSAEDLIDEVMPRAKGECA